MKPDSQSSPSYCSSPFCRRKPGKSPLQPPHHHTLRDFKLVGDLNSERAAFTLNAVVKVENSKGGSIELLSGPVALTELGAHPRWKIRAEQNRYVLSFNRSGEFPVQLKFKRRRPSSDGWNTVQFQVASGPLQQIVLQGLAADTQFQFEGAARPERTTNSFVSYLPSDGQCETLVERSARRKRGKIIFTLPRCYRKSASAPA